jgi:hypothetical protein
LHACIPQDARGDISSAANGYHKIRVKLIEDLLRRLLAELVDLRYRALVNNLVNVQFARSRGKSEIWGSGAAEAQKRDVIGGCIMRNIAGMNNMQYSSSLHSKNRYSSGTRRYRACAGRCRRRVWSFRKEQSRFLSHIPGYR